MLFCSRIANVADIPPLHRVCTALGKSVANSCGGLQNPAFLDIVSVGWHIEGLPGRFSIVAVFW